MKKYLTTLRVYDKIINPPPFVGWRDITSKNLKKLCKKVLTRVERCDIIVKLSAGAGSDRSLKIEQQEISTKQKASANLVERVIYTQTK